MTAFLKEAEWINGSRIARVSYILLALGLLAVAALILTSSNGQDFQGRPLGTDFSNVWSAGKMTLDGRASEAYDPALHHAAQKAAFSDENIPFYGWHYPPFFLMAAALLALVPYTAAWLLWMAATLPFYLNVMIQIVPGRTALLAACAFPAVFVNFIHGQNGFLTAALIGGAFLMLRKRQIAAGVLIGLLAYKPQFGVLIPLALMAGGYWRAFASASATVILLIGVSTALFSAEIWAAFFDSSHFTRTVVLETGETGWEKIQSLFSALRMWGAPLPVAYGMQGLLFAALAGGTIWLWRSETAFEVKAAGLITASLLATPYAMDYDLMALAPAIAFLVSAGLRDGFRSYEKSILAFVWIAPLITRATAEFLMVPAGLTAMVLLLAVVVNRALKVIPVPSHSLAHA